MTARSDVRAQLNASAVRVPRHVVQLLLLLIGYGLVFAALHRLAAVWGGSDIYSFWYPAAGARFVLLWRLGPRFGLGAAVVELLANLGLGSFPKGSAFLQLAFAAGVIGTPLAYTAVVALVRQRARRLGTAAPLPMAVAAVLGPIAAALTSLACWALIEALSGPLPAGNVLADHYRAAFVTFVLGDTLGLLLIAQPFLLWLDPAPRELRVGRFQMWSESALVMAAGWGVAWLVAVDSPGFEFEPLVVAVGWIAVRGGAWASWAATIGTGAVVLPLTAMGLMSEERMDLHLELTVLAITALLIGSVRDAKARLRHDLALRERALFHAERLKTLRAMSLAVIHEISQPLSTLAIEARQARRLAEEPRRDEAALQEAARIVEKQSERLSAVVTRLRSFGSRGAGEFKPVPVPELINDVAALAAAEARKVGLRLETMPTSGAAVLGDSIELQQAMLNLVLNAIKASASSPGGVIRLAAETGDGHVVLAVDDAARGGASRRHADGMGLGLNITRAIAEAHGGTLRHQPLTPQGSRYEIRLPLLEVQK